MAPVYDALFERWYRPLRRRSLAGLVGGEETSLLVAGAGTGLDLSLLPRVRRVLAVDLSTAMVVRGRRVASRSPVEWLLADAGRLPLRTASIDGAVVHLVLCAAPDPAALVRELARVVRAGGEVRILDHFAPRGGLGAWRRLATKLRGPLGTDFSRTWEEIFDSADWEVVSDDRMARGVYRLLRLRRRGAEVGRDEGSAD